MSDKTRKYVGFAVLVVGICLALAAIRSKAVDPQSSTKLMTWAGIGISFFGLSILSKIKRK
jgi:hypothetical protein